MQLCVRRYSTIEMIDPMVDRDEAYDALEAAGQAPAFTTPRLIQFNYEGGLIAHLSCGRDVLARKGDKWFVMDRNEFDDLYEPVLHVVK